MSQWLFGPDSMMWRVNRESVLLIGGRAALLMQLAHPLVAAGVSDHSDYRADPIGRLRGTLDTMLDITFGEREVAAAAMRRVNSVHDRVKGLSSDGVPYSARDPQLAKWVFSTLVYSSVAVYEACVEPLTDHEKDVHYEETKVVGRMFGIPSELLPGTRDGLQEWMRTMVDSGEVSVTPLARDLAAPVLNPLPLVPTSLVARADPVTAALLPRRIREGYGLKLGRSRSALLAVGRRASRRLLPLVPGQLRLLPAARNAEARAS